MLLQSSLPHFSSHSLFDNGLDENSDLHRGCGGVAIIWNKSINATTVTLPGNSDRICGVTLHLSKTTDQSNTMLTINIFNVYFPSCNHNRDDFMLCLLNLEEAINSLPSQDIPILIAGDFNAHLGTLAGVCASGSPNDCSIETTFMLSLIAPLLLVQTSLYISVWRQFHNH